jgi:hypothetical protein
MGRARFGSKTACFTSGRLWLTLTFHKPPKAVDQPVAVDIRHVAAIRIGDDLGRVFDADDRVDYRVELVARVLGVQKIVAVQQSGLPRLGGGGLGPPFRCLSVRVRPIEPE